MKEKIIAFSLFFLVIGFVFINTIVLGRQLDEICRMTEEMTIDEENLSDSEEAVREVYDNFKKKETFISLSVNHENLTDIKQSFSEIIGYLSVGDADGASMTKNRLIDSLEHLRRLSGFNIDAII